MTWMLSAELYIMQTPVSTRELLRPEEDISADMLFLEYSQLDW